MPAGGRRIDGTPVRPADSRPGSCASCSSFVAGGGTRASRCHVLECVPKAQLDTRNAGGACAPPNSPTDSRNRVERTNGLFRLATKTKGFNFRQFLRDATAPQLILKRAGFSCGEPRKKYSKQCSGNLGKRRKLLRRLVNAKDSHLNGTRFSASRPRVWRVLLR